TMTERLAQEKEATERAHLRALYDILNLLSDLRETDEQKVWTRILEKLSVALDTEAATYFIVGPKGRQLVAHYSVGVAPEKLAKVPIEIGQGICGWVAAHREPVLVEDAYRDGRFLKTVDALTGFKTRSVLCLPLMDRLDLVGVIELLNRREGSFTREDLIFVETICRQAAIALRMTRQEGMLHKVTAHNASILENLTGGFLAIDLRGRVMICNPAARRILEVRDEIVNIPVDQALAHIPAVAEVLTQTLSTRQIVKRKELFWKHRNETRTLGYSTILIQDPRGEVTGTGITFQDITPARS
ncbi:MAG: GAF domain-containing protein, partial [Elusimicrobia bacterium]|nr:GAF domain-containing protein [Elusimicrobiota bacterium]